MDEPRQIHRNRRLATAKTILLLVPTIALFAFVHQAFALWGREEPPLFAWLLQAWKTCGITDDYWYCPFMPVVAAGLFLARCRRFGTLPIRSQPAALLLLAAGVAVHGLGLWFGLPEVSYAAFVLSLTAVVWVAWGGRMPAANTYPLLFLLLAVPLRAVDAPIHTVLQHFAATVTHRLLRLIGFHVKLDGLILDGNRLSLQIAPECSGWRAVISLVLLALFVTALVRWKPWRRAVLVALSAVFALLGNLLRLLVLSLTCIAFGQPTIMRKWAPDAVPGSLLAEMSTEQLLGILILPFGATLLFVAYCVLGKQELGTVKSSMKDDEMGIGGR